MVCGVRGPVSRGRPWPDPGDLLCPDEEFEFGSRRSEKPEEGVQDGVTYHDSSLTKVSRATCEQMVEEGPGAGSPNSQEGR